jgi:hypothetical protein
MAGLTLIVTPARRKKTMHIYIDESGDTGFKFAQGSSRYFVVTMLLVDDMEAVSTAVDRVRTELGWPSTSTREFKFFKTDHAERRSFLQAMRSQPLRARILVVDKGRLEAPSLRKKEAFYDFLVKLAVQYHCTDVVNAILTIDESFKGKSKQVNFKTLIRKELNAGRGPKRRLDDVRYQSSHANNLLQCVDMITGAIARSYEKGEDEFRSIIEKRIEALQEFPG